MSQAKRDENRVTVGMGVNATDLITPLSLIVDPVTNRLLVDVVQAVGTGVLSSEKRDQNHIPTAYGVNDSDRVTPMAILIEAVTGTLAVDIIAT